MSLRIPILLGIFGTAGLGGSPVAAAEEPRYCEAGLSSERFTANVRTGHDTLFWVGRYKNGLGIKVGCRIPFWNRFWVHGDFSHTSVDASIRRQSQVFTPEEYFIDDAYANRWRVGAGRTFQLSHGVQAHIQASARTFTFNPGGEQDFLARPFVCPPIPQPCSSPGTVRRERLKSTNANIEAGISWRAAERLNLGAFAEYDFGGGLKATRAFRRINVTSAEEFRAGPTATLNLYGPVALTARYAFGRTDIGFLGVRAGF